MSRCGSTARTRSTPSPGSPPAVSPSAPNATETRSQRSILLLRALERWAAEGRYTTLRLDVFSDNRHAIGLYRRNGFDFLPERGELAQPDEPADHRSHPRVERVMVKAVAPAIG
ncbi:GNAT family N-acetyltransferase [Nocardia kruczakiae]|uniref:GNAT family N-acetyltransferase n=1 Tax=Nocardia kruczakiae TaxID=261477 RepID=UPI000A0696DE